MAISQCISFSLCHPDQWIFPNVCWRCRWERERDNKRPSTENSEICCMHLWKSPPRLRNSRTGLTSFNYFIAFPKLLFWIFSLSPSVLTPSPIFPSLHCCKSNHCQPHSVPGPGLKVLHRRNNSLSEGHYFLTWFWCGETEHKEEQCLIWAGSGILWDFTVGSYPKGWPSGHDCPASRAGGIYGTDGGPVANDHNEHALQSTLPHSRTPQPHWREEGKPFAPRGSRTNRKYRPRERGKF